MQVSPTLPSSQAMLPQRQGVVRIHTERGIKTLATASDVKHAIKNWDAQLPSYLKPGKPEERDAAHKVLSAFTGQFRAIFHLDLKPHKSPIVGHEYYGDETHVATARFSFPQDAPGTKNTLPVIRTSVWDQLLQVSNLVRDKALHSQLVNAPKPHPRETLTSHLMENDFAKLPDAVKQTAKDSAPPVKKVPSKKPSSVSEKPVLIMSREKLLELKEKDNRKIKATTGESYLEEIKRKWLEGKQ